MDTITPDDPIQPPTAREKAALKTLVEGIVLAQGNIFIKELLRRRNIKIGSTKTDFVANMMQAIEDGALRRWDVDAWLDEVEGWGDQHVYLYRVPQVVSQDSIWSDRSEMQKKVEKAGLGTLWNSVASLKYPSKRTLTGVYGDGPALRFVWHQGLDSWVRDKSKDYTKEIDGDLYEFRAHRQRAERLVMRFEIRQREALAAVFIQTPWSSESHSEAISEVKSVVSPVVDFSKLNPLSISKTIKNLDSASLDRAVGVKPQLTRLAGAGAYIEFASTSERASYQDNSSVRDVRRSVKTGSFKGLGGVFRFSPTANVALERDIKVQLYGIGDERVRLWAQMTALEVWEVLRILKSNA